MAENKKATYLPCEDFNRITAALLNGEVVITSWSDKSKFELKFIEQGFRSYSYYEGRMLDTCTFIWPVIKLIEGETESTLEFGTFVSGGSVADFGIVRAKIRKGSLSPNFYKYCWNRFVAACVAQCHPLAQCR